MTMPTEAIKISGLAPPATLDGTEIILVVKNVGGVLTTMRPTVAQLVALVESNISTGVTSVAGEVGVVTAAELKAALAYNAAEVGADASGTATAAVGAHAGASDPHSQYAKKAPKITSAIASNTVTPAGDTDLIRPAGLAAATTIANPSAAPADGWGIVVELIDDGSARALAWGSDWISYMATLPTTTTAGKVLRVGAEYNAAAGKFRCMFAQVQT